MTQSSKSYLAFLKLLLLLSIVFTPGILAPEAYGDGDDDMYDPIEPVNRGIFWFNEKVDDYVLEPVAVGYKDNIPKSLRVGVSNFFENLKFPIYFVNDVLQLKMTQAWHHTARFVMNSTVGVLGFTDPATPYGIPNPKEDFGLTLASYGVPSGPYLVLPILGPSNLRDGVGRIFDFFLDPMFIFSRSNVSGGTKTAVEVSVTSLRLIDARASVIEAVKAAKESALDYYLFMQSAYAQYRGGLVNGKEEDDTGLWDNKENRDLNR